MAKFIVVIGIVISGVCFFLAYYTTSIVLQSYLVSLSANFLVGTLLYLAFNILVERRNWRGSLEVIRKELLELSNMLVSYVDIRILGDNMILNLFDMDNRLVALLKADINKHLNRFNDEDWRLLSYNMIMMREKLKNFVLIYSPAITTNKDLYSKLLAVYRSFSKFDDWFGIAFASIDQRENESFKHLVKSLSESVEIYLSDVRALREAVKK